MHKLWLPSFILLSNPTTRGGMCLSIHTLGVTSRIPCCQHGIQTALNTHLRKSHTCGLLLAQHSAHFRFCYVNDFLTPLADASNHQFWSPSFSEPSTTLRPTTIPRSTAVDPPNSRMLRAIHCLTLETAHTINETASELETVVSLFHIQVNRGSVNTCTCLHAWQ